MIFKGVVKCDENANWYAEGEDNKVIDADFLTGIDNYLESLGVDVIHENEEIEVIIKLKDIKLKERKEDQKW